MPRVFACLVIANFIVVLGVAALGLYRWDPLPDRHIVLAVLALLLTCLVQVVAFTYMSVTRKMIAQAVHLGGLGPCALVEAKRLARAVTILVPVSIVAVVLVAATGARHWSGGGASGVHILAASAFFVVYLFVSVRTYVLVVANHRLLDRTLAAFHPRRAAPRDDRA